MSDGKVVDIILHCQKQIKKQGLTEEKLLHYLGRLSRLRVTVQDLADTGIGRTVNSLSRNEGPVGRAAETLVRGWKRMVSEQQTQAEPEESEDDSGSNSGSSEDEEEEEEEEEVNNEENQPYEVEDQEEAQPDRRYSNGHQNYEDCRSTSETQPINRNRNYDEEEDDDDDIDDPYMNEDGGFLDMSKVQADVDDDEEDVDDKDSDSVGSERLEIDADEDEEPSHDRRDDKPSSSSVSAKHLERHQPDDREPRSSQSSKSSSSASISQKSLGNDQKKHSGSSSSSSKSHRSLERSNERSHSKEHKHHHHRSSSKELSSKEHTKQSSSNGDQHSSKHSKSHHHHSSSSKPEKVKESKIETEKSHHHNHKDKHHRVKETSSHSHHREKESKSEKTSSSSRDKKDSSEHRSSSSGHHKDKTREPSSSSSTNSPKKSSLDSVKKEELVHKSRDDRKRKEHSSNSPSESSASKKSKLVLKEEIDSNSGINFADVLGSLDVSSSSSKPSSSKKDHKRREEPEKSHRSSKHDSHHSHSSSSRKHDKHSSSRDAGSSSSVSSSSKKYESPSKKSIPQSKIESVIQPVVNISPHYKPSVAKLGRSAVVSSSTNGNGIVAPPPLSISPVDLIQDLGTVDYWENGGQSGSGQMSQEDAISTMLSSRNARSKVFSGNKSTRRGEVTSLYDLCMQVIKDNIGELGYTGGIPYEILKPALERANPQQLMNIESQNDYLIGETDELWQFHCKRDFRGKVPAETESWRELYERCTEERQLKFEVIKKQMKKSLEKAEPQRKAKLAYVDTTSTTRFNRQKAQTIKNGMKTLKIKEEKGPSRGVASSASAGFNNPKKSSEMHFEEAAVIIAPESRAGHAPAPSVSREASAAKLKPKKAPLMQKTMKLIKSLHRR